jgi:ribosome-associated protein
MNKPLSEALEAKTSREVVNILVEAINDAKGTNLSLINVSKLFDLSDYFIIASARSDRQVQGISNKVLDAIQKLGLEIISIEGQDEGQWVLIDLGDIVVHIFYEATREYYDFDSLWARAERIKLDDIPEAKTPPRHAA